MAKWIRATEKMPRRYTKVWVCGTSYWQSAKNRHQFVELGHLRGDAANKDLWCNDRGSEYDADRHIVTHWKPYEYPKPARMLKSVAAMAKVHLGANGQ